MGFNEAQAQAIQHTDSPCLVLAGPGSGKTLTIVNRVKYLIEKQKVRACEKTRVFSCVLLLMIIIIVILHKKGHNSPSPIRMLL